MSEPIQTISKGNYILATPQEVSHDNTLSGNGTVDSPLGVVNGYNETVLWEADLNVSVSDRTSGTTFSLSESPTNFENLKIYCAKTWPINGKDDCGAFFNEVSTAMLNKQNNGIMMLQGYMVADKVYQLFTKLTGCLTTTITEAGGLQTSNGAGNLGSTVYLHPYKIVGINRIANN